MKTYEDKIKFACESIKNLDEYEKVDVLLSSCIYGSTEVVDIFFNYFRETVNLLLTNVEFVRDVNDNFEAPGFQYLYKKWKSEKDKKWLLENLSDTTRDKKLISKRRL